MLTLKLINQKPKQPTHLIQWRLEMNQINIRRGKLQGVKVEFYPRSVQGRAYVPCPFVVVYAVFPGSTEEVYREWYSGEWADCDNDKYRCIEMIDGSYFKFDTDVKISELEIRKDDIKIVDRANKFARRLMMGNRSPAEFRPFKRLKSKNHNTGNQRR